MAFFPDLSLYSYSRKPEDSDLLNVGWLDVEHPFAKGPIDAASLEKLRQLAANPVNLCRGKHRCNLCPPTSLPMQTRPPHHVVLDVDSEYGKWLKARSGNGEIRIRGKQHTFSAPVLIVHYIEEHGYLPPAQFLDALSVYRIHTQSTTSVLTKS